jgi:hypothetical protein
MAKASKKKQSTKAAPDYGQLDYDAISKQIEARPKGTPLPPGTNGFSASYEGLPGGSRSDVAAVLRSRMAPNRNPGGKQDQQGADRLYSRRQICCTVSEVYRFITKKKTRPPGNYLETIKGSFLEDFWSAGETGKFFVVFTNPDDDQQFKGEIAESRANDRRGKSRRNAKEREESR